MSDATIRSERDTMGEVTLDARALWGANTERARRNLPVALERRMPKAMILALARIKAAYAQAACEEGLLAADIAAAIQNAAESIVAGAHDEAFPLDVFQTGSGTSSNMNVNEVLANLANQALGGQLGLYKPVNPNDHVNFGQSSNDTIPAALHLAALEALDTHLLPALDALLATIDERVKRDGHILKCARTHWQDALPISFGHIFGAYAAVLRTLRQSLSAIRSELGVLPLGGTACGTGFQAPLGLPARACEHLSRAYRAPLRSAETPLAYMAGRPVVTDLMGRLAALGAELARIANDLRVMASGPRLGLGRDHPARPPARQQHHARQGQPGRLRIAGTNPLSRNGSTRHGAGRRGARAIRAERDLPGHRPKQLLGAISLLANGAALLDRHAFAGLTINEAALAHSMNQSLALATALIRQDRLRPGRRRR